MCESNMISVSPVLAVFPYTIPAQFTVSAYVLNVTVLKPWSMIPCFQSVRAVPWSLPPGSPVKLTSRPVNSDQSRVSGVSQ